MAYIDGEGKETRRVIVCESDQQRPELLGGGLLPRCRLPAPDETVLTEEHDATFIWPHLTRFRLRGRGLPLRIPAALQNPLLDRIQTQEGFPVRLADVEPEGRWPRLEQAEGLGLRHVRRRDVPRRQRSCAVRRAGRVQLWRGSQGVAGAVWRGGAGSR